MAKKTSRSVFDEGIDHEEIEDRQNEVGDVDDPAAPQSDSELGIVKDIPGKTCPFPMDEEFDFGSLEFTPECGICSRQVSDERGTPHTVYTRVVSTEGPVVWCKCPRCGERRKATRIMRRKDFGIRDRRNDQAATRPDQIL